MQMRDGKGFWKISAAIAAFALASALVLAGCPVDNEIGHTHDWGAWVLTTAPTCTTEGVETRTCRINPTHVETRTVAVDPDAHEWGEWEEETAPTCTEPGVGKRTCTRCEEPDDASVIPALGHEWGEWDVRTAPTCTEPGTGARVCTRCEEPDDVDVIPALGHEWGEWDVKSAPTCTEPGTGARVCTRCEKPDDADVIPALGHEWGGWGVKTAPTCTEPGVGIRTCTRCEEPDDTNVIPALGHDMGEWIGTLSPTCTTVGTETSSCQHTGCGHAETRDVDALGHDLGGWEITTPPTCTTLGTETGTCQREGCSHTGTRDVSALGHDWSGWETSALPGPDGQPQQERYCRRDGCSEIDTRLLSLVAQLEWLRINASSFGEYTVEVRDNETIVPQTLEFTGSSNVTVTLVGSGGTRTVGLSENGTLFTVGSGVTFRLDTGITLQGRGANDAPLVVVDHGGTLIMEEGARITGNINISTIGGGVVTSGVFIMNGGEISSNETVTIGTAWRGGGGVLVSSSGMFTMNDGSILRNSAISMNGWSAGGGVLADGTFTMNGGDISRNTSREGAGVCIGNGGIFTMHEGTVSHNSTTNQQWAQGGGIAVSQGGKFIMHNGAIDSNDAYSGGGVVITWYGGVDGVGGIFTMHNGRISGNTAMHGGGGVYVGAGDVNGVRTRGMFTMYGGEISDNEAAVLGGGVNALGTFAMHYGSIVDNFAALGGGVHVWGGTFSMDEGEISGNSSTQEGGGVRVGNDGIFVMRGGTIFDNHASWGGGGVSLWNGTFRISDGIIYGRNAAEGRRNTAGNGAALYLSGINTAEHGTFNGAGAFSPLGNLPSTNNTIEVINGVLQGWTWILVFDLANDGHIQGLEIGETDHLVIFEGTGLARAGGDGNVAFEVVGGPEGQRAIRVTVTPDWAGLDMTMPGFGFREGDEIRVSGQVVEALAGNQMLLNINHAGWQPLGGWQPLVGAGETFEFVHTLSDSDVAAISGANPPAIRIRTNQAGVVFEIWGITVSRFEDR